MKKINPTFEATRTWIVLGWKSYWTIRLSCFAIVTNTTLEGFGRPLSLKWSRWSQRSSGWCSKTNWCIICGWWVGRSLMDLPYLRPARRNKDDSFVNECLGLRKMRPENPHWHHAEGQEVLYWADKEKVKQATICELAERNGACGQECFSICTGHQKSGMTSSAWKSG